MKMTLVKAVWWHSSLITCCYSFCSFSDGVVTYFTDFIFLLYIRNNQASFTEKKKSRTEEAAASMLKGGNAT